MLCFSCGFFPALFDLLISSVSTTCAFSGKIRYLRFGYRIVSTHGSHKEETAGISLDSGFIF